MNHLKYNIKENDLTTYLIEDRRSKLSPWGKGNSKLGPNVYTYSKLPGTIMGSCPGSSAECEMICYAKKLRNNKAVWELWSNNTDRGHKLPELPHNAKIIRFHVSGDFDTKEYIQSWIDLAKENSNVIFYGYTRSWRIDDFLALLEEFRSLSNVHLFASIDKSIENISAIKNWRRAWLENDNRIRKISNKKFITFDNKLALICPEENGFIQNCETCQYCFKKQHLNDLVFLEH